MEKEFNVLEENLIHFDYQPTRGYDSNERESPVEWAYQQMGTEKFPFVEKVVELLEFHDPVVIADLKSKIKVEKEKRKNV